MLDDSGAKLLKFKALLYVAPYLIVLAKEKANIYPLWAVLHVRFS
jgi:hypothetical protein